MSLIREIIIDILKTIISILIRLILAFYIWNMAICQYLSLPKLSIITIFHIWLFINILLASFAIEKVDLEEDMNNNNENY